MGREAPIDPDRLLAHAGWMRELARSLLHDPAAADDVVQDATLAAWIAGPAEERGLAPWLARVVRNFAYRRRRADARRAEREALRDQPAIPAGPEETVARLELQRTLVDAVSCIEEPLRTTIVLRYFEGRSSAQIARSLGIPAGTVRWRLKRGLEELRARLDATRGSRESWVAWLAPFAIPAGAPPVAVGTAAGAASAGGVSVAARAGFQVLFGAGVMKTVQWVGAALLAGVLAWWGWNLARRPEAAVASEAPAPAVAITEAPLDREVESRPEDAAESEAGAARESVPAPAPVEVPAPAPVVEELVAVVEARFVDEIGTPLAGVRFAAVGSAWAPGWKPAAVTESDARGNVSLRVPLPVNRNPMGVARREYAVDFEARSAGRATVGRNAVLRADETKKLGFISLAAGGTIHGRVVDSEGGALEGILVGVAPVDLAVDPEVALRHGGAYQKAAPRATTTASGDFTLEGAPLGRLRVWAHGTGFRHAWTEPVELRAGGDLQQVEIVLQRLLATDSISGRVLDPDGVPFLGAHVWIQEHWRDGGRGMPLATNEEGRFEFLVDHDEGVYDLRGSDVLDRYGTTSVTGVHGGARDVEIRLQRLDQFFVRVRGADGRAVEGARFRVSSGGMTMEYPSRATSEGEYSIAKPTESFHIQVNARGFRTTRVGHWRTPIDPATLPRPPEFLEVVLLPAKLLRGRVTADEMPVAGARVFDARHNASGTGTTTGYRSHYFVSVNYPEGLRTDEQGRFELDCDHDAQFWLRITADGWAPWESGPLDASSLDSVTEFTVELTHGGAIEGRVLVPAGESAVDRIVGFNHGDSVPFTLRTGANGSFRAEKLAPGKWQVLPAKGEIRFDGFDYASVETQEPIPWSCEVRVGETTRFDVDLTKP